MHWHLTVFVVSKLAGRDADCQSCTDILGEDARFDIAYADGTGSLIQTASADFRVRRNPQSLCHFGENGTDKLARFPNLGQILFVNAQIGKHFRPVFFRADISVLRGCQQGTLADVLSGELIDDIILQQQDVPHLCHSSGSFSRTHSNFAAGQQASKLT